MTTVYPNNISDEHLLELRPPGLLQIRGVRQLTRPFKTYRTSFQHHPDNRGECLSTAWETIRIADEYDGVGRRPYGPR